jgi:hypothetical protein
VLEIERPSNSLTNAALQCRRRENLDRGKLAMASKTLDEPAAAAGIEDAFDFVRFDEIARLAEPASSYWRSIALAADRGETLTVATHCKQVIPITREACLLVRTIGASGDTPL